MPEPAGPACHKAGCGCHHGGSATAQSLAEVAFLKSAARAAQAGDLARLQQLLGRRPDAVDDDGTGGVNPQDRRCEAS